MKYTVIAISLFLGIISIGFSQSSTALESNLNHLRAATDSINFTVIDEQDIIVSVDTRELNTWVNTYFNSWDEAKAFEREIVIGLDQLAKNLSLPNTTAEDYADLMKTVIDFDDQSLSEPGPFFCHDRYVSEFLMSTGESLLSGIFTGESAGVISYATELNTAVVNFHRCIEKNY